MRRSSSSAEESTRPSTAAAVGRNDSGQFFKTKMCPFHLKYQLKNPRYRNQFAVNVGCLEGTCANGDPCRFAHSLKELRPLPDLSKTKLCSSYSKRVPCSIQNCPFAHSPQELRTSSSVFYKVSLCNFYKNNRCWNGSNCRFAHGNDELRDHLAAAAAAGHDIKYSRLMGPVSSGGVDDFGMGADDFRIGANDFGKNLGDQKVDGVPGIGCRDMRKDQDHHFSHSAVLDHPALHTTSLQRPASRGNFGAASEAFLLGSLLEQMRSGSEEATNRMNTVGPRTGKARTQSQLSSAVTSTTSATPGCSWTSDQQHMFEGSVTPTEPSVGGQTTTTMRPMLGEGTILGQGTVLGQDVFEDAAQAEAILKAVLEYGM